MGEIGPVLLLTLFLSAQGTLHDAFILLAFVAVAVAIALVTTQMSKHTIPVLERTLEHSSQLAVRWTIVLIFALVWSAYRLGLDLLLGGFTAGMITRQLLRDYELAAFESKLTGLAFGLFVPFFFIVSGMKLDVSALFATPGAVAKIFLFFVLFLIVRGAPALLLYRNVLNRDERYALALLSSTQLRWWSRSRLSRRAAATCAPRRPLPLSARPSSPPSCSRWSVSESRNGLTTKRWRIRTPITPRSRQTALGELIGR